MNYLKITFVRIILSFFGANIINELININTNRESAQTVVTILFMSLLYYRLTLYINNRR